jgi:hypothetical protein
MSYEELDSLRVVEFSDHIAGGLRLWPYKLSRRVIVGDIQQQDPLCRIQNEEGEIHRAITERYMQKGKNYGAPVVATCYVCRRYVKKGQTKYTQTSFWCRQCHMPLCRTDRTNCSSGKRKMTCLQEHLNSDDPDLCCNGLHTKGKCIPERLWIELDPRQSSRKKK